MSKRILLLTDSLALPRLQPEICLHQETWPELLKAEGYHIHQVSIGGATSEDLMRQCVYHKAFYPDLVIVQAGIVDCAPRFMTKFELSFFQKIPFFGRISIRLLNQPLIRRIRKITYVKPEKYFNNLNAISKSFNPVEVYFLGFTPIIKAYEKKAPGITKNVKKYNEIIRNNFNYISLESIELSGIMSDFHHLNSKGHKIVYEKVVSRINNDQKTF